MWTKKEIQRQFDVSMGAFDGAEVSQLKGLCIQCTINEGIGLCRNDGLAVLRSVKESESERTRKRLHKTFQDDGLSISSQSNMTSANVLNIAQNLITESYKPYRKLNNQPLYIDKQ